ncbi:MAG TPA: glycerophosphodiester phosphodiesterase [Ilumatobacteraceae bacterium]
MPRPTHPYLDWPGPCAIAHRGGASDEPENTMPAFQRAVDLGYVYLETDVHVTKDGVVVAFHDPDLLRTTGRPGRIRDLTWTEVSKALVAGREPIPRLEDLLDAFPDARVNIDCKADSAVAGLVSAIRRTKSHARICIGSFSDQRLLRLRAALGNDLCTSLGPAQMGSLKWTGRLFGGGQAVQTPVRYRGVTLLDRRLIERAHARGLKVHVWTIDDPRQVHRLLDLGVDGIMTDRPAVLKDVLVDRGQWHET